MTPVRLEPAALRSRVKYSTTEPLRSQYEPCVLFVRHRQTVQPIPDAAEWAI